MVAASAGRSASRNPPVDHIIVGSGERVGINDHVYISPPWAPGQGEPYIIARVMEFVMAAPNNVSSSYSDPSASSNPSVLPSSPSAAADGEGQGAYQSHYASTSGGTLQIRANFYFRNRDISHRFGADARMLIATMHADLVPLSNIRGKCVVKHRDEVVAALSGPRWGAPPGPNTAVGREALAAWRSREDHFLFCQMYDRYIHRFYDVIPTDRLRNAPAEALECLRKRYSYVLAEVGMAADLTDSLRGCNICHRWAASAESVRCDTCKQSFHMRCLTPPLTSKPSKGYSWTCAPCSKRHADDVEDHLVPSGGGTLSASHSSTGSRPNGGEVSKVRAASAKPARGAKAGRGGRGGHVSRSKEKAPTPSSSDLSSDVGSPSAPPSTAGPVLPELRCFNMWPYRYFGLHTEAMDVLDAHDSIYPRATTRQGPKYQVTLPTWEEQLEQQKAEAAAVVKGANEALEEGNEEDKEKKETPTPPVAVAAPEKVEVRKFRGKERGGLKRGRDGTPVRTASSTPSIPINRGSDDAVEPIFLPTTTLQGGTDLDLYMREAANLFPSVPSYNVDLMNAALAALTKHRGQDALALMDLAKYTPADLRIVDWSLKEIRLFEEVVKAYGAEMQELKKRVPTKTPAEIVRFFHAWKTNRLKESWAAMRAGAKKGRSGSKSNGAPSSPSSTAKAEKELSSARSTLSPSPQKGQSTCAICAANVSPVWWKAPHNFSGPALCDECGVYWRKYATKNPMAEAKKAARAAEEAAANAAASASTSAAIAASVASAASAPPPVKKQRVTRREEKLKEAEPTPTPPPAPSPIVPAPAAFKCALCRKTEPKRRLAQCSRCSLAAHAGCYGLSFDDLASADWKCEACANEETLASALIPRCILCPPPLPSRSTVLPALLPSAPGRRKEAPSPVQSTQSSQPFNPLDALKPTEGNNWTHVICAVWTPEVVFSDAERLKIVEGVSSLPPYRWSAECTICHRQGGACSFCADCRMPFHLSCAFQTPGYTFGFEIQPVKSSRRDIVATSTFKDESGHMSALVWCKNHKDLLKAKTIYDFAEVDPATGMTALQTYVQTRKLATPATSNTGDTYPLLRKAKRFDAASGVGSAMGTVAASTTSKSDRETATPLPVLASYAAANGSASAVGASHDQQPALKPDPDGRGAYSEAEEHQHQHRHPRCLRCETAFSPFWWPVLPPPPSSSSGKEDAERTAGRGEEDKEGTVAGPEATVAAVVGAVDEDVTMTNVEGATAPPQPEGVCCNQCRPYFYSSDDKNA